MILKISDDLSIPLNAIQALAVLSRGGDCECELVAATATKSHPLWKGTGAECRTAHGVLLNEIMCKGGDVVTLPTGTLTSTAKETEEAKAEAAAAKPKAKGRKGGSR